MLLQYNWKKALYLITDNDGSDLYVKEVSNNVFSIRSFAELYININCFLFVQNTNHGECTVNYNATMTIGINGKIGTLIKTYKPKECSNFVYSYKGYFTDNIDPIESIKVCGN